MISATLVLVLVAGGVAAGRVGRRSRGWAIASMLLAVAIDVAILAAGFVPYALGVNRP